MPDATSIFVSCRDLAHRSNRCRTSFHTSDINAVSDSPNALHNVRASCLHSALLSSSFAIESSFDSDTEYPAYIAAVALACADQRVSERRFGNLDDTVLNASDKVFQLLVDAEKKT